MNAERLYELMSFYLEDKITHAEMKELDILLSEPDLKVLLEEHILKQLYSKKITDNAGLSEFHKRLEDKIRLFLKQSDQLQTSLKFPERNSFFTGLPINIPFHFVKSTWLKYAAVFILVMVTGFFFWNKSPKTIVEVPATSVLNEKTDIPPGGNKAILKLSDGNIITLDKSINGIIATQGYTSIIKTDDGQIKYDVNGGVSHGKPLLNTMITPRGGQYKLRLPDGSLVWLDSESSITYPVVFTGKERNVMVEGQVYFEVAKNENCPFFVKIKDGVKVRVIGTHFNIRAINEEPVFKTTLLEGSIKLIIGNKESLMKPGQQAQISSGNHDIRIISDVDTDEVIAWKDGLFSFINSDIQTIMKQCAKWYDVDVYYQGNIPYRFVATISRDVPISKLLKILEMTGRVHFKINGKKITVMP